MSNDYEVSQVEDGSVRENFDSETRVQEPDAAARMEKAVYAEQGGKKKKKKSNNGFRAVVITALICSLVGGGIGGAIGVTVARSQTPAQQVSSTGDSSTVQLVGNQGEISPVVAIAKKVVPSVVGVKVYSTINYWGRQYEQQGSGSGIIYSDDGYIITNYHVVEGATSVSVTLSDGREYEASIVGTDEASDLAVIKVEETGLPEATFGKSSDLELGELVVAIGNPLGYDNTVTDGIVSGLNRQLSDYTDAMTLIQTNAAINSGNSGGALVNSKGEVVGINSAKLVYDNAEGMGFALSIDEVKPIVEQLISQGNVSRPYMGVVINNEYQVDAETAEKYEIPMGILIESVVDGGPAQKAGLRAGDIIYKVDDRMIQTYDDLSEIIASHEVGDVLRVLADREGQKIEAQVTLAQSSGN